MAGSRLERIGTIFSRAQGLLKSGAMKYQDRPIWYDIYRIFPPKYEPYVDRQSSRAVEDVPDILYREDKVRARFFKEFGLNPDGRLRRLHDHTFEDPSQEFINRFNEVAATHGDWGWEEVFKAVAEDYQGSRPQRVPKSVRGGGGGRRAKGGTPPEDSTTTTEKGGLLQMESLNLKNLMQGDEGEEEEGSVSAEILRSRKIPLVTKESLRSLFEEAKGEMEKKTPPDDK